MIPSTSAFSSPFSCTIAAPVPPVLCAFNLAASTARGVLTPTASMSCEMRYRSRP